MWCRKTIRHNTPMRTAPPHLPARNTQHTQSRSTRWPVLLAAFLSMAVVAGIIGGFIGKSIESHKLPHTSTSQNANADPTHPPTPTCPITNTTQPTTVPVTGCPKPDQFLTSAIASVKYVFKCYVDWVGDDLVGVPARSGSECIEACWTWNVYGSSFNSDNKTCMGATWVPAWAVNLTEAWILEQRPSSCFLKSKIAGHPAQNVSINIVGLRLDGYCPSS